MEDHSLLNRKIWGRLSSFGCGRGKGETHLHRMNITALIEKHSNEELFEKKSHRWTGTT
ncbi:MAG: ClbS/DfsB family four-helix bundle protein [Cytophagaceae bacterium]|nr:ClbS/DfsB family four-helix bundle protein [Cytophagaceae bacterium]